MLIVLQIKFILAWADSISLLLSKSTVATDQSINGAAVGRCYNDSYAIIDFYFSLKLCMECRMWNVLIAARILRKIISRQELNVSCISKLSVENLDPALVLVYLGMVLNLC